MGGAVQVCTPFNFQKKYDNSSFAVNCIDYLLEEPDENEKYLFEIKNKQIESYPFNQEKLKSLINQEI